MPQLLKYYEADSVISHEHKCIFIHIPKCAGTSIESALGHLDGNVTRGGQDHRSIRMIQQPVLVPAALTSAENVTEVARRLRSRFRSYRNPRNCLRVTREQYESYFKFTIIRNPWSRVLSAYQNLITDEIHRQKYGIDRNLNLTQFLRRVAGRGMLRPQTHFIKDFQGSIPLDFIGRFESLNEDFARACQLMGLSPPPKLPHKLKGQVGPGYREQFDDEANEIVCQVYRDEIVQFAYSF